MRKYYYQSDLNSAKVYVQGKLKIAKAVDDYYSLGTNLKGDALIRLVRSKVDNRIFPQDSKGIYLVLTSEDVREECRVGKAAMCKDYCGYHLTGNFTDGSTFYYAMVSFLIVMLGW